MTTYIRVQRTARMQTSQLDDSGQVYSGTTDLSTFVRKEQLRIVRVEMRLMGS